jgi:hypothetical protein
MALRNNDLSNIWSVEQMTFRKYGFCSNFGKVTVENLTFSNLGFGKKRSTVVPNSIYVHRFLSAYVPW